MAEVISIHFSKAEMACKCGKCDGGKMDPYFLAKLEGIRKAWGRPMKVNSGYRCREHNQAIKGSPHSQHLLGLAVDIALENPEDRYQLVGHAIKSGMKGIGIAKTFIHLDLRKDNPKIWLY